MSKMPTLTCPHCAKPVDVSEALTANLETQVRAKLQSETAQEKAQQLAAIQKLEAEQLKKAKEAEATKLELLKLQRQTEEMKLQTESEIQRKLNEALKAKESKHELELEALREQSTEAVRKSELALQKMKSQIEKDLTAKMATEFATNEQDLKNQLAERDLQIKAARAEELELRKSKRELEERQATLDLEIQRKLDLERTQIAEEAMKAANAKSDLIVQQQAHRIQEMQKAIDESARKAMQGSQQSQGEALELKLEAELALLYPDDVFEPVQKGMRGADLIQRVRAPSGRVAGTILWEFKQTKAWSDDWIHKLKDDQRELSAELAAIISNIIPPSVSQMGTYESVWVTKPGLAKAMAHTMREQILHVHQANVTNQIPADQKEMVFKYLTGTKFRQSIDGEIQTVNDLLLGLQKEKRSFQKAWATREQQYNQLIGFKAGLYGDLQGILGKSLPNIANLELDLPPDEV